MSIYLRFFSGFVTTLPSFVFWILISLSAGCEYYWKSYFIVSGVFLAVSFAIGFFIPTLAPKQWKRHPTLWLFGQGLLAWLVAIQLRAKLPADTPVVDAAARAAQLAARRSAPLRR